MSPELDLFERHLRDLPHLLTGRWILWWSRRNLLLTDRLVRRYYEKLPSGEGTYPFFLARKPL